MALVRAASLPWNRARIHFEFARRRSFCRWPVHGNVLEMLQEGRLELGEHVLLEPGVWLTAPAPARIRIGGGSFLNLGVQVAAVELVEIGEHCMFANGCFVTDGNHRFDDPDKPVPWQGFTSKGPTRIGDNVWCGANVVDHQRRHDRRALRDRRQLGRDDRPAAVLDRRRRAREGPARDHLPRPLTRGSNLRVARPEAEQLAGLARGARSLRAMAGTLIARELHKAHGAATILAGVSVTVAPGDVLGVVGPNGAGQVDAAAAARRASTGPTAAPSA